MVLPHKRILIHYARRKNGRTIGIGSRGVRCRQVQVQVSWPILPFLMMMNGASFTKLGSRHGGKRETITGNQVQVGRCAKCRSLDDLVFGILQ
jgi:hypothetical protein